MIEREIRQELPELELGPPFRLAVVSSAWAADVGSGNAACEKERWQAETDRMAMMKKMSARTFAMGPLLSNVLPVEPKLVRMSVARNGAGVNAKRVINTPSIVCRFFGLTL